MDENHEQNEFSAPESGEQDLVSMVKRMQQHLVFLEKKIDMLTNKVDALPRVIPAAPSAPRPYSAPDRRPDSGFRGPSHDRGSYPSSPFNRHQGHDDKPRSFGSDKPRSFGDKRSFGGDADRGNSHPFKKTFGGGKRTPFGAHGKPFYGAKSGGSRHKKG